MYLGLVMHRSESGFTLFELLAVAAIVGVLATVAIVVINPQGVNKRARDARRKADLESIRQALELYRADNGEYPSSAGCSWGWRWSGCDDPWIPGLEPDYISEIPEEEMRNDSFVGDSPHTLNYNYKLFGDGTYHLLTQLENASDLDINGGEYGYWNEHVYVVTNP